MPLHPLTATDAGAWLSTLVAGELTLLYKHSPTCGISFEAADEVRSFAVGERRVRVYQLDVVRQRALSQALAQALAVTHHSPQVILLDGATPVWHTSHSRIRATALADQVQSRLT